MYFRIFFSVPSMRSKIVISELFVTSNRMNTLISKTTFAIRQILIINLNDHEAIDEL